mgnify:FL=1
MREIRLICKKELSRVLTDRKMLFSIISSAGDHHGGRK